MLFPFPPASFPHRYCIVSVHLVNPSPRVLYYTVHMVKTCPSSLCWLTADYLQNEYRCNLLLCALSMLSLPLHLGRPFPPLRLHPPGSPQRPPHTRQLASRLRPPLTWPSTVGGLRAPVASVPAALRKHGISHPCNCSRFWCGLMCHSSCMP